MDNQFLHKDAVGNVVKLFTKVQIDTSTSTRWVSLSQKEIMLFTQVLPFPKLTLAGCDFPINKCQNVHGKTQLHSGVFIPDNFFWDQCCTTLWILQILNPVEKLHSQHTFGEDSVSIKASLLGCCSSSIYTHFLQGIWLCLNQTLVYFVYCCIRQKKHCQGPGSSGSAAHTDGQYWVHLTSPAASCWKMSQHWEFLGFTACRTNVWNTQKSLWSLLDMEISI